MSTEPEKVAPTRVVEVEKAAPSDRPPKDYYKVAEAVLRLLLLASLVVAVVIMVTSKETEIIPVKIDPFPPLMLPLTAKFTQSPAFIYFVAGLSVAGLYTIISTLASFYNLIKPGFCPLLLSHFIILDVLMLGIVASAIGAAGGVAYIGLKGNSHVGWTKICNKYGKLCRHLGGSLAVSLVASLVLVVLIILSIRSLSKKIPK